MFNHTGFVNDIIAIVDGFLWLYFWILTARVIISWVNPDPYNLDLIFNLRDFFNLNRLFNLYLVLSLVPIRGRDGAWALTGRPV